jgi:hypothetical protein
LNHTTLIETIALRNKQQGEGGRRKEDTVMNVRNRGLISMPILFVEGIKDIPKGSKRVIMRV